MKRLYSTEEWKARSRRRAEQALEERRRWRELHERRPRRGRYVIAPRLVASQRAHTVPAPAVFSLINNPAGTTLFLSRLGLAFYSRNNAFIDLRAVEELTSDAIVVLLSKLNDPRFVNGMHFRGNEPDAAEPRRLLNQSGFFDFVRSAQLKEPPADGRIRRKTSFIVESETADELVAFATTRMLGRPQPRRAAVMALIEAMANTYEHAGGSDEEVRRSWWANVYCPQGSRRAFFTNRSRRNPRRNIATSYNELTIL